MTDAPFNFGDWVCLDRDNYEVQIAIESEWPFPLHQRQLQNFSFGQILECVEYEDEDDATQEIWCHIAPVNNAELWLPASWLYRPDRQHLNEVLIEGISSLSPLLPTLARISVAGTPFDLKILPADHGED